MKDDMILHPEPWLRPVFVITTGRSGSTLLIRYLNCASDLVVWGEHAGILCEVAAAYAKLLRPNTVEFVEAARPRVAQMLSKQAVVKRGEGMTLEWVNSFDQASINVAFRELIVRLFTVGLHQSTRWGFKEIRYGRAEMALLRALFPDARFILLLRNPAAILRSKFRWFALGKTVAMPLQFHDTLNFLKFARAEAAADPDDVLLLHYERLTQDTFAEMDRIGNFIGSPFIAEQICAIESERAAATPFETDVIASIAGVIAEIGLDVAPADLAHMAEAYEALLSSGGGSQRYIGRRRGAGFCP